VLPDEPFDAALADAVPLGQFRFDLLPAVHAAVSRSMSAASLSRSPHASDG
jgi:hypothetical protein